MFEKDWPKILGGILGAIFLFILMSHFGVRSGIMRIIVVALLAVSLFGGMFGSIGGKLRLIFGIAAVVVFVSSWWFTRPAMQELQHSAERALPRENFDPKAEVLTPMALFYRGLDGSVHKVGMDWRWNPETSEAIARPGSTEHMRLLLEYEMQEAKKSASGSKPKEVSGFRVVETHHFILTEGSRETPELEWKKAPAGSSRTWYTSVKLSGQAGDCVTVIANGRNVGDDCVGSTTAFDTNGRLGGGLGTVKSTRYRYSGSGALVVDFFTLEHVP